MKIKYALDTSYKPSEFQNQMTSFNGSGTGNKRLSLRRSVFRRWYKTHVNGTAVAPIRTSKTIVWNPTNFGTVRLKNGVINDKPSSLYICNATSAHIGTSFMMNLRTLDNRLNHAQRTLKTKTGIPNKIVTPTVVLSIIVVLRTKQSFRLMATAVVHHIRMKSPNVCVCACGNVHPTRTETVTIDETGTNVSNSPKANDEEEDDVAISSEAIFYDSRPILRAYLT
mmetsp:Transcript_53060/g.128764  ORF Transcript_53060/g.128764 Transcript_53060/m.128764 type:complete len:225 (+) Transcript_53060:3195-3869(+)